MTDRETDRDEQQDDVNEEPQGPSHTEADEPDGDSAANPEKEDTPDAEE